MSNKFYFHVDTQEKKFSGYGTTCFNAAVAALGQSRAERLARNTTQTKYFKGGEVAGGNEAGVSRFISSNGITVASVTRLV